MEYENIGGVDLSVDEHIAVDVLVGIANVINWWIPIRTLRLSGGSGTLALRPDYDQMMIDDALADEGMELATQAGSWAMQQGKRVYNATRDYFNKKRKYEKVPKVYLRGGSQGAAMLAWKNSLTKMYHTYQTFNMSPVLKSVALTSGETTKYVHQILQGNGPHLYWTYVTTTNSSSGRNNAFNELSYWDGGFGAFPTEEVPYSAGPPIVEYVPAKNFKLGQIGTIYIFAADWPGTIMNTDVNTQSTANQILQWADFVYQGTVTTTNYPRKWTSVFANKNWQYLTVYGIQYRFDVTNISARTYVLEISLFRFKADIDAMDYEKQCLAHFGGYHTGTNAYTQKLSYLPMADVTIIKTKRFRIQGMKTNDNVSAEFMEGTSANNRTIKWNIKRRYVMKRPLLNSYEDDLTEKQIFTKYYEQQKGMYFRFMAWPDDINFYTNSGTGMSGIWAADKANPNIPAVTHDATTIGSGLQIQMYKKAYFKLDENSTTF